MDDQNRKSVDTQQIVLRSTIQVCYSDGEV